MKILVLSHWYPPAPQRFTAEEIAVWRRSEAQVDVLAFKRVPGDRRKVLTSALSHELETTFYLPEFGWRVWLKGLGHCALRPLRTLASLVTVATGPYLRASDLRLRSRAMIAAVRSIAVIGFVSTARYDLVHADFADEPATVAWIVHKVLGIPFTFRDHLSFNPQLIDRKVDDSTAVLACCEANRRVLLEITGHANEDKVVTSYLGVDVEAWQLGEPGPQDVPLILCIGTLQEKKGQKYLVGACKMLADQGVAFRCVLAGDGNRSEIDENIAQAGLQDRVSITGYVAEDRIRELIRGARVVCLPSVTASNGDSDGIPVALMEAMAAERPCVATSVGGISELIEDEVDGLIVVERDHRALAEAIKRILTSDELGSKLGRAAREKIESDFELHSNAVFALEAIRERSRVEEYP